MYFSTQIHTDAAGAERNPEPCTTAKDGRRAAGVYVRIIV
jgi:hypothetical protein